MVQKSSKSELSSRFFGRSKVFGCEKNRIFENVDLAKTNRFRPKIVKIRAILAIFRPFEVLGCQKSRIFERPFTPRGWLRSASNFGKTRFRRSPTFHLSTSKKKFRRKFLKCRGRGRDRPEVGRGRERTARKLAGGGT